MKVKLKDNWELDSIVIKKNGETVTYKYDNLTDRLIKIIAVKEEELKELFVNNLHPKESTMTHQDSSNKPSVESEKEVSSKECTIPSTVKEITPSSENSTKKGIGSGNYYHKPKIPQDKIDTIKKIYENYPDRSIRTVAKEVGLDQSTILRWKKKLFPPKEESWHD